MSLEDKINERLVADEDSILESELKRVENMLQIHNDGTINLEPSYRELEPETQMLAYLIGQRFAAEGGKAEEDTVKTSFFYEKFSVSDRTVRTKLQNLRDAGLTKKEGQSKHAIVVENLPKALDRIEEEMSG